MTGQRPDAPGYERDRDERGRPANARPRDRFGRPLPRGAVDELAGREQPEDAVASVPEAFDRGVALFDEERFFEAHEFLEYVWKHDAVPVDREFWKGVTQVAVGCCHVQRGNTRGAVTLLDRARDYLAPYPDVHRGVDVGALRQRAAGLAAAVRAGGASPGVAFPRFPLPSGATTSPQGRGRPVGLQAMLGLGEGKRYRCGACGNLTRFDVETTERVRRFWHAGLSGDGRVEEEERSEVTVESVTCRWCGSGAVEVVGVPGRHDGATAGPG